MARAVTRYLGCLDLHWLVSAFAAPALFGLMLAAAVGAVAWNVSAALPSLHEITGTTKAEIERVDAYRKQNGLPLCNFAMRSSNRPEATDRN